MKTTDRHLTPKATKLINASNEEKIEFVWKDKWIEYSAANQALKEMQRLIDIKPTHRPKNLLLLGDSKSGKTKILEKFQKNNPSYYVNFEDHYRIPSVKIQAPDKPSPRNFYINILNSIGYPHKPRQATTTKQYFVFKALSTIKCQVLIIDQIQLANGGSAKQQREFINSIKNLSEELNLSIIVAGTEDAFPIINSVPQMAKRFKPLNLNRWTYSEEFLQLLYTLEAFLPLKEKSNLHQEKLARKLLSMSEGLIGEITTIIKLAFTFCVGYEKNKIDLDVLNALNYFNQRKNMHGNES